MLNVGVFGVGHLGKYHLNNWKEKIDAALEARLNRAFEIGVNGIEKNAANYAAEYGFKPDEAIHYLMNSLDFSFDKAKYQALQQYLDWVMEDEKILEQTNGIF